MNAAKTNLVPDKIKQAHEEGRALWRKFEATEEAASERRQPVIAAPSCAFSVTGGSEARRLHASRRNMIAEILVQEGSNSDSMVIVLATYFSNHMDRPEGDKEDDDLSWGKWVMEKTNAALDRIATAVDLPNVASETRRGQSLEQKDGQ